MSEAHRIVAIPLVARVRFALFPSAVLYIVVPFVIVIFPAVLLIIVMASPAACLLSTHVIFPLARICLPALTIRKQSLEYFEV